MAVTKVAVRMIDGFSPSIDPEETTYGAVGTTSSGTANNVTTAFTNAMAAAIAQKRKFVTRGYFNGTRKWFKITPGFEIPDGLEWEVDGKVGIIGSTATGRLMQARNTVSIRGDLIFDGGNTGTTIATAYISDHEGLVIAKQWKSNVTGNLEAGSGYGTRILGIQLEGLHFQNFGSGGLETYFLQDPDFIRNITGQRLGWFGILHMSPLSVTHYDSKIVDVWPGIPASPVYLSNSYGMGCSHWGGDAAPQYMEFNNCIADTVTSWEGFDMHGARESGFVNCKARNCSQGFVFENHTSSVSMQRIYTRNCAVEGYGETVTRDSQPYYSLGGIIVNATSPASQTQQVEVLGNSIYNTGEGRPATQNGGGITIRGVRNIRLIGNTCFAVRQHGINLIGTNAGVDNVIYAVVNDNLIDGVTSHAGVQRGISAGTHVLGVARGNFVQGISSFTQAYNQAGSPTYVMAYGPISDGSVSIAASANVAYGAS